MENRDGLEPFDAVWTRSAMKHFCSQEKQRCYKNWHIILVKKTSVQLCPTASFQPNVHRFT